LDGGVAVEFARGFERLDLVRADRLLDQAADVGVLDHRREHLRVAVRDDVGVVPAVPEPLDAVADVLEHVEFV